ncbi:MAG: O-antigen ligase family protein [Anaerolineae bacterium]|nr:O-antigen ligase family protein [Anaerolineae bacterium]
MSLQRQSPFERTLSWLQLIALALMIFLSVISRPRQMLLEVSPQWNIPIEFRIVSISIPDIFVLALLLLTVIRLVVSASYRDDLFDVVHKIITRAGGLWWGLLVLWVMVGLAWANEGTMLRFHLIHVIALLVMALITAGLARERGDTPLLVALIASGVVQSIIGLLQVLNNGPLGWYNLGEIDRFDYDPLDFYRAPGLAMHYNYLAGYLMIALFACMLLGYRRWSNGKRILPLVLAGAMISIGILSTLSRGALLSTAIGMLPLVVMVFLRLNRRARLLIVGGLVALVVLAVAYVLFVLGGIENIQTRFLTGREFFFDYSWSVIQTSPVLGVGAGNLMLEAGKIYGLEFENLLPVHNVYLYIWAELGLPGLALFLIGSITILWRLRHPNRTALFIWTSCFLAICAVNLFDNYFWAVAPFRVVFFWVIGMWWYYVLPLLAPEPVAEPETPPVLEATA